jgi:hypothetical protein
MTSRKLTLRREALTELTTSELGAVAGASGLPCNTLESLLPTCGCTGNYSLNNC